MSRCRFEDPAIACAAEKARPASPRDRAAGRAQSFRRDDAGAGTAWWVLWMVFFLILGGVSVDSANAWRMRAQLQATADAAAHAGVIDLPDAAAAIQSAKDFAAANMASSDHGDVLATADVEIGVWDNASETFTPSATPGLSDNAIRVTTRRDEANANALRTSFLRLIGLRDWDVSARAVAQRYTVNCDGKDGIFAGNIVDLQSNNHFRDGICIHGNSHVEVNNGNTWDSGVQVSMPNVADLVTPSSDLETQNPGLIEALTEEWYIPKIAAQMPAIVESLLDPTSPWIPDYIGVDADGQTIPESEIVIVKAAGQIKADNLLQGHIYHATCGDNQLLTFGGSKAEIRNVVIVSDCRVLTPQDTLFENVILAGNAANDVTDTIAPYSINIGQDNQLGADDSCDPSGNVTMLAKGSLRSAAGLTGYGMHLAATKNIVLTPNTEGLHGVLLEAGGDISITSNNAFGSTCAALGLTSAPAYRLVL